MTGPRGGTERGTRTPSRSTGIPGAVVAIALVLVFGLALRLIIAYVWLPGSGFGTDVRSFQAWAGILAEVGPGRLYESTWVDYTPGYLYVLWLVGIVGNAIGGIGDLIKFPPILADVAIGYLAWSMTRELGARHGVALLAALLFVLNPVSWFDTAVWGQVDSFGVVFLLLSLRELWRDRPERAAILAVVAMVIKPQLGILAPLVAVVTIRRALWPVGGYGDDAPPDPAEPRTDVVGRLLDWERATARPIRIVTTGVAAFVTAVVLSFPFGLSVVEVTPEAPFVRSELLEQVGVAAGGYPYVTVNAYNPWALVPGDTGRTLAHDGVWMCDAPGIPPNDGGGDRCSAGTASFGPIPAVAVGTLLLLVSIAGALWFAARHPDRRTLLVVLAVLAMAFFVVPTRVHERYMFPFFALGAILAAVSVRWRIAYVLLSAATFANMYVVLTTIYDNSEFAIRDWLGIGDDIRGELGVALIAMTHLLGFVWAFAQLRGDGRERLADEIAEAGPDDARPLTAAPESSAPSAPSLPPPRAEAPATAAELPGPPAYESFGPLAWLRERVGRRPVRADRSALLRNEGGGRFDRLDVWLLVVLVVATLSLRTFRLGEPLQMHFDEVYHARTATEFLQHWRYGESHDIYEWTHPHLGKYAIAAGIVAFGDDRVSATSSVGAPVRDALLEPRHDDLLLGGEIGARLWLATDTGVIAYDLASRARLGTVALPGARALAIDRATNQLLVATDEAEVHGVDLSPLDVGGGETTLEPYLLASAADPLDRMLVSDDGTAILGSARDAVVQLDAVTGETLVRTEVAGVADLAEGGTGWALVATPGSVTDAPAVAQRLAELSGRDQAELEAALSSPDERVVLGGLGNADQAAVDEAIAAGSLPGIEITEVSRIAVAGADGITFLDRETGTTLWTLPVDGGAHGLAYVTNIDDPRFYVTTGTAEDPGYAVVDLGDDEADDGPSIASRHPLPGLGGRVGYDLPTRQVHILGAAPDGTGSTVYVVEPHANAVYADARLPFEPSAWAFDIDEGRSTGDRQQLLAFAADGRAATVDIGQHAFSWRMPGVIAGALMAGLLFLLARILFRRRAVAVLAGLFVLADGMLFAQSRIAMNDVYVGLFIIAAYTLFAGLWTGRWRWPLAFWLVMPAIGLLLGLALASKWVAAYAIGALFLLILARSALGRILLIVGLIGITVVLGYMAITVPEGGGAGNVTFLLIMIGLTLTAVVATITHPIAWSDDEFRLAVLAPAATGAIVFFGALAAGLLDTAIVAGPLSVRPLEVAILFGLLSPVVYGVFWLARQRGFGPLAAPPAPDDPVRALEPPAPAPNGWLRPGRLIGLPISWAALSLVALPVVVYVISYLPWAAIENHQIIEGWPAGHSGQTLLDLTGQMYRYHNELTSAHAASSPWWAWPFDLKPVWFYQGGFDNGTSAAIYDAGNLVIWWLGVPAMLFVTWQAYRRRSLALALIAIGFAAQWIPWARIDRAAFQYHYYTALPFVVLALAYFVAELWHGASRRTWLLARAAAAIAILAPALMHLFLRPLCGFVDVNAVNEGSAACRGFIPDFVLTWRTAGLALVVGGGVLAFLLLLSGRVGAERDGTLGRRWLVMLTLTAAAAALLLAIVVAMADAPLLHLAQVPIEPIAALVAIPLGYLAVQVLSARDAHRFVAGIVVAVVLTFLVFYPNFAALPLPSTVFNAYQGLLPTYLYDFQFPVSTVNRNVQIDFFTPLMAVLAVGLVVTCLVVAYSAWTWRVAAVERALDDEGAEAPAGSPG